MSKGKHGTRKRSGKGGARTSASTGSKGGARRSTAAAPPHGAAAVARALDPGPGRTELWVKLAGAVFALLALLVLYLGLRPGGVFPVLAYRYGQTVLGVFALVLLLWGAVATLRRRPRLRKGRIRAFVMLVLVVGLGTFPFPYPSSREFDESDVRFTLPVEGEWRVHWGGDTREANRYAGWFPGRRWALALVREVDGATHVGTGEALEDWHAFGEPVLAPAPGSVVRVVDDVPDHPAGRRGGGRVLGNHVVIEVADGEFLFLCHLQEGSIAVTEGARVARGTVVARVGNSGATTVVDQPHLALHLQTTAEPGRGEGIPWRFADYVADGRPVERGLPRGGVATDGRLVGQIVRRAEP